jgi:hypothetical protein
MRECYPGTEKYWQITSRATDIYWLSDSQNFCDLYNKRIRIKSYSEEGFPKHDSMQEAQHQNNSNSFATKLTPNPNQDSRLWPENH